MSAVNASIRVESKNKYVIEVNDEGDTIEFDLTEVGLPARLLETYEKLEEIINEFEKNKEIITKRKDKKINDQITQNQKDLIDLTEKYYKDARICLDGFLGEDACQKIFGSKNYYSMFEDLFEVLGTEFQKMGLNMQNMQKNLVSKYAPKSKNVLK